MTAKHVWFAVALLAVVGGLGWAFAWFSGLLATQIDDLQFVALDPVHGSSRPDNMLLKFRSQYNLRKVANDSGAFGAYAFFSLCPFHENPWVSIGRVKHNGIDLDTKPTRGCGWRKGKFIGCNVTDDTPAVHAELANVNQPGPYIYEVFFVYDGSEWQNYTDPNDGGRTARQIPLPDGPQDLCVKLHGDGGPPGFNSNVVRIPKEALSRAYSPTPPTSQPVAAPAQKVIPPKWKNITIAVSKDETVAITADGKPISCEQFNAYYAAMTKSHVFFLDCKRFKFRLQKQ